MEKSNVASLDAGVYLSKIISIVDNSIHKYSATIAALGWTTIIVCSVIFPLLRPQTIVQYFLSLPFLLSTLIGLLMHLIIIRLKRLGVNSYDELDSFRDTRDIFSDSNTATTKLLAILLTHFKLLLFVLIAWVFFGFFIFLFLKKHM